MWSKFGSQYSKFTKFEVLAFLVFKNDFFQVKNSKKQKIARIFLFVKIFPKSEDSCFFFAIELATGHTRTLVYTKVET